MSLSAIQQIDLTAFGQTITGIKIKVGATVDWNIACEDPNTRAPLDLTGSGLAVVMSLCALDMFSQPAQPPVIAHQANIVNGAAGTIHFRWAVADTVPVSGPLAAGIYFADVWLTDGTGNRLATIAEIYVELVKVATLPTTLVTPVPGQPPLGQGPQGPPGDGAIVFIHAIGDTDGSDFEIVFSDETDLDDNPVPNQPNALYTVRAQVVSGISFTQPIIPRGDQSTGGFHVILSADLPVGTSLQFEVTPHA